MFLILYFPFGINGSDFSELMVCTSFAGATWQPFHVICCSLFEVKSADLPFCSLFTAHLSLEFSIRMYACNYWHRHVLHDGRSTIYVVRNEIPLFFADILKELETSTMMRSRAINVYCISIYNAGSHSFNEILL